MADLTCEVCGTIEGDARPSDGWARPTATVCEGTVHGPMMKDVHRHMLCWACTLELTTVRRDGVTAMGNYPRCPDRMSEAELAMVVLAREGAPRG